MFIVARKKSTKVYKDYEVHYIVKCSERRETETAKKYLKTLSRSTKKWSNEIARLSRWIS